MGVDIYGTTDEKRLDERHKGSKPPHFRRTWWSWRPLWEWACDVSGIITAEERKLGHYNCGVLLNTEKTKALAEALRKAIDSGAALDHETLEKARHAAMADEVCNYCEGTGKRTDIVVEGGCNVCHGTGEVRPTDTWYEFSVENAKEFVAFLEQSDGMTIY